MFLEHDEDQDPPNYKDDYQILKDDTSSR